MPSIKSHQSLGRHPRMLRLAARVGICGPQVLGHLHLLWWWALDSAPDGDLSPFTAQEIAGASEWTGDPALWLAALNETGRIKEDGHLHDWQERKVGKLAEERARDRDRKRAERARRKAAEHSLASGNCPPDMSQVSTDCPPDVRRTSNTCPLDVPGTSDGCPSDAPLTSAGCPPAGPRTPDRCPPPPRPASANGTAPGTAESENARRGPRSDLDFDAPSGFPSTEAEAAASGVRVGAPAEFATKLWHLAASRGWRDARNIPLRS